MDTGKDKYLLKEVTQNIWFHKDENGKPIWKDTFVYAITESNWGREKTENEICNTSSAYCEFI